MYNNRCNDRIYPNIFKERNLDSSTISSIVERCPKQEVDWGLVTPQARWHTKYSLGNGYDKPNGVREPEPPDGAPQPGEEVLGVNAIAWVRNSNLDCRPKLFDKASQSWKLCDSGSMVTVIKKSETDGSVSPSWMKNDTFYDW